MVEHQESDALAREPLSADLDRLYILVLIHIYVLLSLISMLYMPPPCFPGSGSHTKNKAVHLLILILHKSPIIPWKVKTGPNILRQTSQQSVS